MGCCLTFPPVTRKNSNCGTDTRTLTWKLVKQNLVSNQKMGTVMQNIGTHCSKATCTRVQPAKRVNHRRLFVASDEISPQAQIISSDTKVLNFASGVMTTYMAST